LKERRDSVDGIWIRSQSKVFLVCTKHVEVEGTEGDFWITAMDVNSDMNKASNVLGDYKTEERALQVLADIQNQIVKIYNDGVDGSKTEPVFNMPAE
jgi:hypothetical protein